MKNTISKFAAFLVLLAVSFTSCSDSDDFDFAGEDNYITKLAITVDGVTYNASIVDDEVTLTVPTTLSLSGATVDYKITEKATISPDPATKSDWAEEDMFVVTSYNNIRRSYTYRVVKDDVAAVGNVILNTQSEVEAFAEAGNSIVNGNLTIGKSVSVDDPITSLESLSSLKTIAYNLTIGEGYTCETLEGFESLESVGAINIDDNEILKAIDMPALTSVGTSLNLLADNLESVSMDTLESIGADFTLKSNMIINSSFAKLSYVGGDMIFNGSSTSAAKATMERIQFPSLAKVDGKLYLNYWSKVYVVELPKLAQVGGELYIDKFSSELATLDFSSLSQVGEMKLTSINVDVKSSFPALDVVDGKMTLSNCKFTDAIDVSGISMGTLSISGTSFSNIASIIGDDDFDGELSLGSMPSGLESLPELQGFKSVKAFSIAPGYSYTLPIELGIEEVKEQLLFSSCSKSKVINFESLKSAGSIKFTYCNELLEVNFPALESITGYGEEAGSFDYMVTSGLEKLDLSSLVSVNGDFSVTSIDSDATMSKIDLSKIETIGGALTINGGSVNANFNDLSTFSTLTSVGSVAIKGLTSLGDFFALRGVVSSLDASAWSVSNCAYNPSYDEMVADAASPFRVLTFEDASYKAGVNYIGGNNWSSLIDSEEYFGSMLYSSTKQYTWTDKNNTYLNGVVNQGVDYETWEDDWKFWTGGIVVSNYYMPVVADTEVTYENQLSLSNGSAGAAGNNGSANFAIVNDGAAGGMGMPVYLSFGDGKARTIDHLYISSTSYLESVAIYGNSLSDALGADDTFNVTAVGFDANGDEMATTVTYEFVKAGKLVTGWNKWDLSGLGKVSKIRFKITSSVDNGFGMSLPTNFAIDDVAVAM